VDIKKNCFLVAYRECNETCEVHVKEEGFVGCGLVRVVCEFFRVVSLSFSTSSVIPKQQYK
jgi:ferredoxin-like protein FixX